MKLTLRIKTNTNIKELSIKIEGDPNPIFHFDTDDQVYSCIKQLEPIKIEVMQFCKELYDKNCKEYELIYKLMMPSEIMMDWDKQIIPLLRQYKIQNLLSQ